MSKRFKENTRYLVRCNGAGVHIGNIQEFDPNDGVLVLTKANRLWRWSGAHDLSVICTKGVNRKSYTRISCELPELTLMLHDICEIIPVAKGVDLTEVHNE